MYKRRREIMIIDGFYAVCCNVYLYIPRDYNYFSVKKMPDTCIGYYDSRECA